MVASLVLLHTSTNTNSDRITQHTPPACFSNDFIYTLLTLSQTFLLWLLVCGFILSFAISHIVYTLKLGTVYFSLGESDKSLEMFTLKLLRASTNTGTTMKVITALLLHLLLSSQLLVWGPSFLWCNLPGVWCRQGRWSCQWQDCQVNQLSSTLDFSPLSSPSDTAVYSWILHFLCIRKITSLLSVQEKLWKIPNTYLLFRLGVLVSPPKKKKQQQLHNRKRENSNAKCPSN